MKEELTDDPPLRKRHVGPSDVLTTSDEDSEPEAERLPVNISRASQPKRQVSAKPVLNRILENSSSNSQDDKTKSWSDRPNAPSRSSPEPSVKSKQGGNNLRETVVGSFSDEEEDICSKISGVHVSDESRRKQREKHSVRDTVIGSFSELSMGNFRPASVVPDFRRQPQTVLRDTIVQSSSEDEAEEAHPRQAMPKTIAKATKQSLADTIIDPSESLAELSLQHHEQKEDENSDSSSELSVISVLDSEEESIMVENDQPPVLTSKDTFYNCSSPTPSFEASSAQRTVDSNSTYSQFFNNPPMISDPALVVTHSEIRKQREAPKMWRRETFKSTDSLDRFKGDEEEAALNKKKEDLDIPQTDDSSAADDDEVEDQTKHDNSDQGRQSKEKSSESEKKSSSEEETAESNVIPSQSTQLESQDTEYEVVNISANIRIALKIHLSCSSSTDSSSSDEYSPPPKPKAKKPTKKTTPREEAPPQDSPRKKQTPRREATPSFMVDSSTPVVHKERRTRRSNKKAASGKKMNQAMAPGSGGKQRLEVKQPENDFKTPSKAVEPEIDEEAQSILDSLYGDAWKTPQLLKSCKSRKDSGDLRKTLHANKIDNRKLVFVENCSIFYFCLFLGIKSLSKESPQQSNVEVTPEPPPVPKSSTKKTPRLPYTSTKKTPFNRVARIRPKTPPPTPSYLDICDSDTPSDDDPSDDDFKPNDTWNASSDEEYNDEAERIKKRLTSRLSRMDEQIIFVPSDSPPLKPRNKIDDFLEQFEYKKPPGLGTPPRVTKKKLFTHDHYEDADDLEEEDRAGSRGKENVDENAFVTPLRLPKKPEIKTPAFELPFPVKKTPVPKLVTPKSVQKEPEPYRFRLYSFLKSLDCETSPTLCDPDALVFRKNYKSKKSELTERLFKLYNEKVFDNVLTGVPIVWNKKLLNTAGRCNNSRKAGIRQSTLELSEKVLTSADRLRCTLIHEMCHAATWIIQGENGHGYAWKRWAAKANNIFPELPKINVCHDYIIEYKYVYQCTNCKAKSHAHSKSKKVENIRCSICKGSIELFENKKDKDGKVVMTPVQSKEVRGFPKFVQLKYKDVKRPGMSHKEAMQLLSEEFKTLSVEQKQNL